MKALFGVALFSLVLSFSGWAQSTWRGQAELWTGSTAPQAGFVAASNEFPTNSVLTVENYRNKKSIQVRVVAGLPAGSSALVLLNASAADAIGLKVGESPLVGVTLGTSDLERVDSPDPDINPAATPAPVPVSPVPVATPAVRTPETPAVVPSASVSPAVASEVPVPTPLVATTEEPEVEPVSPAKRVFVATAEPAPVTEPDPTPLTVAPESTSTEPLPAAEAPKPVDPEVVVADAAEPEVTEPEVTEPEVAEAPAEPTEPEPVPATSDAPPVAVETPPSPPVEPPLAPAAVEPAPVAEAPAMSAPPVVPARPLGVGVSSSPTWVNVPGKLEGPILGQVVLLPEGKIGRPYIQIEAFRNEAEILGALQSLKSYVPVAVYHVAGDKAPWRLVAVNAPKSQLGVLLMHFRSQGYSSAALMKG